jgi:hypothetical protein
VIVMQAAGCDAGAACLLCFAWPIERATMIGRLARGWDALRFGKGCRARLNGIELRRRSSRRAASRHHLGAPARDPQPRNRRQLSLHGPRRRRDLRKRAASNSTDARGPIATPGDSQSAKTSTRATARELLHSMLCGAGSPAHVAAARRPMREANEGAFRHGAGPVSAAHRGGGHGRAPRRLTAWSMAGGSAKWSRPSAGQLLR